MSKETAQQVLAFIQAGEVRALSNYLELHPIKEMDFEDRIPLAAFARNKTLSFEVKQQIIEVLMQAGWSIDTVERIWGYPYLITALLDFDFPMVQYLINKGAKTNFESKQWMVYFQAKNFAKKLDDLLATGLTIEHIGAALLINAIFYSEYKTAKDLIQLGVDPKQVYNQYDWPALVMACTKPKLEIVILLLEQGCAINASAPDGQTGLMRAVFNGNISMVETLLAHGADWKLKTKAGKTLQDFLEYNQEAVIDFFKGKGIVLIKPVVITAYYILLEAANGTVKVRLDASEWEQFYLSGGLLMKEEPSQYQEETQLIGKITTPYTLEEASRVLEDEAGLVSEMTIWALNYEIKQLLNK